MYIRSKSCRAGVVPRVAQRSSKSESRRASRRKVLSRSTPLAYHSKRRKSGNEARGGEVEGDRMRRTQGEERVV
jgi:hypothetical protein